MRTRRFDREDVLVRIAALEQAANSTEPPELTGRLLRHAREGDNEDYFEAARPAGSELRLRLEAARLRSGSPPISRERRAELRGRSVSGILDSGRRQAAERPRELGTTVP